MPNHLCFIIYVAKWQRITIVMRTVNALKMITLRSLYY